MRWILILPLLAALGCAAQPTASTPPAPLPAGHAWLNAEAAPGRFATLVDFEPAVSAPQPAMRPPESFSILPAVPGAEAQIVSNVTHSGQGALQAMLPEGTELVYRLAKPTNISNYPLLSLAVYSLQRRGDLHVTLEGRETRWRSGEMLLQRGWTDVMIDLGFLARHQLVDLQGICFIRVGFGDASPIDRPATAPAAGPEAEPATEPASQAASSPATASSPAQKRINEPSSRSAATSTIVLDDILLIDNRREITALPEGMRLIKAGLDYELFLPNRAEPLRLTQSEDGLWRLGSDQAVLAVGKDDAQLAGPPAESSRQFSSSLAVRESLSMLGDRRVGVVEVQEHNALRLRIANTWYFRASPGQWLTQECRRVRWEYTFYWDGRWVTQVRLDVSDESGPGAYRLSLPSEAAWSDGQRASSRIFSLAASDHREFLTAPDTPDRPAVEEAFLHPPRLSVSSPASRPSVSGAAEGTFDRAQGCFVVDGSAGLTRFTLGGGAPGVSSVIRLLRWPGTQAVINADGWSIRQYVRLGDQSLLFAVGQRPAGQSVEVSLPEGPVQQSHVAD